MTDHDLLRFDVAGVQQLRSAAITASRDLAADHAALAPLLDDASALLGRRVTARGAADAALESLILEAPEERSRDALPYLHRRMCRQEAILRPVLRELLDVRIQRI